MLFRKSPEQLIDEAERALAAMDYEKARRIGMQLLRMRHTAGFEYTARALWGLNRPDEAIATLRQGVQVAPDLWVLWEYLGHYLSDTGRYGEALDAFRRGMECPNAPQDSFLYNLAIVYQRMGEHAVALNMLHEAIQKRARVPLALLEAAAAYCHIQQGQFSEAEAALQRAEQVVGALELTQQPSVQAMIYAYRGLIVWQRDGDLARAKQYAEQALSFDKANPDAAALMREGNPIAEQPTPLWHILVEGTWFEPLEGVRTPIGFFANYWVIADTPEEALEYIRPFEPPASRPTLKVAEATREKMVQGERKGVVRAQSDYAFYEGE